MFFNLLIYSIFSLCFKNIATNGQDEAYQLRTKNTPLAVIRYADFHIELAQPEGSENTKYLHYVFNKSIGEEYIFACPNPIRGNILYNTLQNNVRDLLCINAFAPTFIKYSEKCSDDMDARMHGVGYWMWNEALKTMKTDFVDIYQICRSETKTYYTTHIATPFSIGIIEKQINENSTKIPDNQSLYQFVPYDDMTTHTQQIATNFIKFNFTAVSKMTLNHLNKVDAEIRKFIQRVGRKFKIHSGRYTGTNEESECIYIFKVLEVHGKLDDSKARDGFVIVTLINSSHKCSIECTDISGKLKPYFTAPQRDSQDHEGSVTYVCEGDEIIRKFGMKYSENLLVPNFHMPVKSSASGDGEHHGKGASSSHNNDDDDDDIALAVGSVLAADTIADAAGDHGYSGGCDGAPGGE